MTRKKKNIPAASPVLNGPLTIQDAWKRRNTVEETDRIVVPEKFRKESRELFGFGMSGTSFLDMLKEDTMLRQCQCEFLRTGTVSLRRVPEIAAMYDAYCTQRGKADFSERIDWDTVEYLSVNPPELPKAVYNWIPRSDYERSYRDALQGLWESADVFDDRSIVPNTVSRGLGALKVALDKAASEGRLHIHVGAAGTGKSTAVAGIVNTMEDSQSACVVSLSNTIGMMFKQRVEGIRNFSCVAAASSIRNEHAPRRPVHSDFLVLDEFSQWGFEWLWLLVDLLNWNDKARVDIMGDTNQIPTFLCSGNLLYAVVKEYPGCVKEYKEQHRFTGEYRRLMDGIVNEHKFLTDVCFQGSKDYSTVDCVITGTNKHVEEISKEVFEAKFGRRILDGEAFSDYARPGTQAICNTTRTIGKGTGSEARVFRNERFLVTGRKDDRTWRLVSAVDNRTVDVSDKDFDRTFSLGYAVTVNRAQGLEWDNVYVVMDRTDYNLMHFDALYVALSRGRKSVRFVTRGLDKSTLESFLGRTNKFTNHFDCIRNR